MNWPADICRQLLQNENNLSDETTSQQNAVAGYKQPTNSQLLTFLVRLVIHKVQNLYQIFFKADQWNIGVVNRPIQDFIHPEQLQNVLVDLPALPNRNIFYADCFARQEISGTVVYFELYDYRVRRGNISKLSYPWVAGGKPEKVLDFPFHLSYPFLVDHYCIPEAWITNTVKMYDLNFPSTSPDEGHLLLADVPGVDTTLLLYKGYCWLFYTRADRNPMLNLFISYADSLAGPWYNHPQNPVKTNIRSSRPAGPFFESDGKLYRPSQDCSRDYGYGITINEVVELTTSSYAAREVSCVPLSPLSILMGYIL